MALPLIFSFSLKQKYKESIPARFFLFHNPPFSQEKKIWFHACSFGEVRALKPFVNAFNKEDIALTTITQTGQKEAKNYGVERRYLPYEFFLPFWIKRNKVVVVLEAEFWYMLFIMAKFRGAKLVLLNARISDRSLKNYMRFSWFYKKMLIHVDKLFVQSQEDKNRFLALGARDIEVVGNIKLATEIVATTEYEKPSECVVVAGSTHEGEEEIVLQGYASFMQNNSAKLIVVPRHPERFESVYELLDAFAQQHQLKLERFSQTKSMDADIILCDMMGELNNLYNIADIAILGGAFRDDVGGHNPLEPAHFGCKIITGKHFFHQKELFKYVHHVQYIEKSELADALEKTKHYPPSKVDEVIEIDKVITTLRNYIEN